MFGLRTITAAAALSIALTGSLSAPSRAEVPSVNTVALGDVAPVIHARTLLGNAPVATSDFAGKVLVVNFWATWCPPCRAETPDLIAAYRKLAGPDVAFLAIDTTEAAPVIKTFVSAKGVPYPVALAGADAYNGFGVAYIPTTLVIDAKGIVRARWTGELVPSRLAQFIADAKAQKNYAIDTPDETLVERLLDPSRYDFTKPDAVKGALADIAAADAFAGTHASPENATVDYDRVQTLEGNVLLPAAQAALGFAQTPQERAKATRLLVSAYGKLNRFADAITALQAAQKDDPTDASISLAIAKADYRLHDYADGIAEAKAYTVAKPDDADGWDELGLEYQRSRDFADAAPAYERDEALLVAQANAAKPADREDANANAADTALDLADVYVALGDQSGAARAFAIANTYGAKLDPKGQYADLYRNVHERTQEGLVAARIAHGGNKTAISIAPWSGPDLPGSLSSTFKYRLIVAKAPSSKIDLRALGLPKGWIASFCADGLCSPMHVSVELPESGVKTYEFQLVPRGTVRKPLSVRIASADGTTTSI
jgi:thiol-disulfide isomerase/thioredoxin